MRRLLFALFCCAGLPAAWASITDVSVPIKRVIVSHYHADHYTATDGSKYRAMPAFNEANRVNAYNQHLRLEQQGME